MSRPSRLLLATGTAVAVALVLAACGPGTPGSDEETSITIRVSALPNDGNWNTILGCTCANDISGQAVYDNLIRFRADVMYPRLAEEFEMSEDGLSLVLQLRQGVTFSDGTPLDAEGVATYFTGLLATDVDGLANIMKDYGTEVAATGEYELTFTTTKPLHDLWMRAMERVAILPPGAVDDPEAYRDAPVGTGPYLLEESSGTEMTFSRNPDYWNPEAFDFDTVKLVLLEDDVAALNALKSGQVDATELGSTDLAAEAEAAGYALSTASGLGNMDTLIFQDRTGDIVPALGDVRVRQAINMAFDREAIAESLYSGFARISTQPFTVGSLHYTEGADDTYTYDFDRAKELLAEAGYADGFELTIVSAADYAVTHPIVEQTLGDLGIRVTWDLRVGLLEVVQDKTSAVHLVRMPLDGGVDWLGYFWGFPTAESAELYRIFQEAAPAESKAAAAELGVYIIDNAWYAPIGMPDMTVASIPEVEVALDSFLVFLENYSQK